MNSYLFLQIYLLILPNETYYHLRPSRSDVNEVESCYSCHTSLVLDKKDFLPVLLERDSVHFKNNKFCSDCHKPTNNYLIKRQDSSRDKIYSICPFYKTPLGDKNRINEICGGCHKEEYEDFLSGVHRTKLDCVYCHNNHGIKKASLDIIKPEKCSTCHRYPNIAPVRDEFRKAETILLSTESFLKDKKDRMPDLYNQFTLKIKTARSMMKSQHHRLSRTDITSNANHILLLSGHIRKETNMEVDRIKLRNIIRLGVIIIIILAISGVLYYLYRYIEWRRTLNKR